MLVIMQYLSKEEPWWNTCITWMSPPPGYQPSCTPLGYSGTTPAQFWSTHSIWIMQQVNIHCLHIQFLRLTLPKGNLSVEQSEISKQTHTRHFYQIPVLLPVWYETVKPPSTQITVILSTELFPLSKCGINMPSSPTYWTRNDFTESKWKSRESVITTPTPKQESEKKKKKCQKLKNKLIPRYYRKAWTFWFISLPFQTLLARKVNRLYTFCWINLQENKGS